MALNRLGVVDAGSISTIADERSLFRTVYLTEVVKAFQENNIMSGITQSRAISSGKSATFPTYWKTQAQYHIPGTTGDLAGTNDVSHAEIVIPVDRVLASDILVAEIDELHNHYDVRSMYAEQQGAALAQAYDKQLLGKAIMATSQAARHTNAGNKPAWDGVPRTITLSSASDELDGNKLVLAIYDALELMESYDIPTDGVVAVFKPQQYYKLITGLAGAGGLAIHRDFGGTGGVASGQVATVAGIPILKSNNLPQSDLSSATGHTVNGKILVEGTGGSPSLAGGAPENDYVADFSDTVGLLIHPTCLATVKLMDLTYESEYLIQKQATLMVAKMAVGHGIVREEGAVVINKA